MQVLALRPTSLFLEVPLNVPKVAACSAHWRLRQTRSAGLPPWLGLRPCCSLVASQHNRGTPRPTRASITTGPSPAIAASMAASRRAISRWRPTNFWPVSSACLTSFLPSGLVAFYTEVDSPKSKTSVTLTGLLDNVGLEIPSAQPRHRVELLGVEGFDEFGLGVDLVGELGQELAQAVGRVGVAASGHR